LASFKLGALSVRLTDNSASASAVPAIEKRPKNKPKNRAKAYRLQQPETFDFFLQGGVLCRSAHHNTPGACIMVHYKDDF
jgi:hypothetical protein